MNPTRAAILTLALSVALGSAVEAGPSFSGRAALGRRAKKEAAVEAQQAAPQTLQEKLQALDSAGSDKDKIRALEAIVVELAARQPAMPGHAAMGMGDGKGMHDGRGMMGKMHADGGMAACPMMGGDDSTGEAIMPPDEHESHHP